MNPSGRWNESTFDTLGRVTQLKTTPDTATTTTSYNGNAVTVTDPTGKSRKSISDALGRVVHVYEDPSGLNYLTSYTYNAVGNLLFVAQGTQTRAFVYDSLGRMTSTTHPESGTTTYTYDANGNLDTRTDARGATATYRYDRMDRNIIVTFAGGGTTTPEVRRHYDGAANGRSLLHWTEGIGVSATFFDAYDSTGRPTQYHQSFWIGSSYGTGFNVQRSYNKAGSVTSQTYPSGRTVTYNYDIAGRLADYNGQGAFAGNLGDGVQRTYASEVRYNEMGKREQERFGTDTAVYNKSLFNNRNQLAEIRVSTYSIVVPGQGTNWNRGAIINHYSNAPGAWGASGGGPDNNGNLKKQEIYVPDNDAISTYTNVVQEYNYDSLNRLTSVYDKPFNGSPDFNQLYTYDRWGNRTIDPNTSGAPEPQFTASAVTNRLAPPTGFTMTYDATGNLTYDNYTGAGTRVYDAENRMTSAQDFYGLTSTYAYDGDGRRVRRTVAGGVGVWQIYGMDGELLGEYAADSSPTTPQKEYGYRTGELLLQATTPVTSGTGLTGQYFDNTNFTDPKLTRTDSTVNFDWGVGSPHATVGVDTFSVRWTGKIQPLYSQTYTFYTLTDDGVRLWVNNQLIIDKWIDQGPTEWSGQIALAAGQRYDIRMEFYENGGGATAKLLWSSASQAKVAIQQSQLYPVEAGNGSVDLRWLVSDQLGTVRMVVDKTGSLTGVTRHDYMPFGEEIPSDPTWRTIARGYVGDNVRQEFTKYERDPETGLDFAKARYYAYAQGRFTSVDPIMMEKRRLSDPQAINLYSYSRNNPLKYIDPSGEKFKGTDGQEVIIKREKVNGRKVWVIKSGNASADLKRLVASINESGSKSANSQFGRLNDHATMINVRIDTTTKRTQEEKTKGSTTTGLHQPHGSSGPLNFNEALDRFDGKAESAVDKRGKEIKGAYKEATITLYELKLQELGHTGDDLSAQLVAVFGHEAQHDLDPIQVQAGKTGTGNDDIWHPREKMKSGVPGGPAKNSPYWFSNKILQEIKDARSKKP